jgi:hypothetical protein
MLCWRALPVLQKKHKWQTKVSATVETHGCCCLFMPNSHPFFNPIENLWRAMKQYYAYHFTGSNATVANVRVVANQWMTAASIKEHSGKCVCAIVCVCDGVCVFEGVCTMMLLLVVSRWMQLTLPAVLVRVVTPGFALADRYYRWAASDPDVTLPPPTESKIKKMTLKPVDVSKIEEKFGVKADGSTRGFTQVETLRDLCDSLNFQRYCKNKAKRTCEDLSARFEARKAAKAAAKAATGPSPPVADGGVQD